MPKTDPAEIMMRSVTWLCTCRRINDGIRRCGGMQPYPVVHCGRTAGFVGRTARSGETIVSALPAPA